MILTPTARLAHAERLKHNRLQTDAENATWHTPVVLEINTWLSNLRHDYFLQSNDARVLISADQSLLLWQSVIEDDVWVAMSSVAELAAGAWRLIHEYSLKMPGSWPGALVSEDSQAMRTWAARFEKRCAELGVIDEWAFTSELPRHIKAGKITLPERICLKGFELAHTPLLESVLEAAEAHGVVIERVSAKQSHAPAWPVEWFQHGDAELCAAAYWARQSLEDEPGRHLAVVVPDLNGRVKAVERAFRRVFDPPAFRLAPQGIQPWHISLGLPLAEWPIVADALFFLSLSTEQLSHPEAIRVARSPFVDGAVSEGRLRSRILTKLTKNAAYWLTIQDLVHHAKTVDAKHLEKALKAWQSARKRQQKKALPSYWVQLFSNELTALGFGHGRPLDGQECQVWSRWHTLLEQFSTLDVMATKPMTRSQALQLLKERAANVIFRERDVGAPVEILGVEEALGSEFDAMWICTLDQDHWPGARQPHPLIPPALQYAIPASSTDGCLEKAKAQLTGLARCAPTVRGSFVHLDGKGEVSPLVPVNTVSAGSPPHDECTEPLELETLASDTQAPEARRGSRDGGTGLLQDQSDCPFKAFAHRRLGAKERRHPQPSITHAQRGNLMHEALRSLWNTVKSLSAWRKLSKLERQRVIQESIDYAFKEVRFKLSDEAQQIETVCLTEHLEKWLALESHRDDFSVESTEEERNDLRIGDLKFKGKIDRIDELSDGGSILIDYKTGKSTSSHWLPTARMEDVQLPIYALNMNPKPVAIAFAKLHPESYSFSGLAEVETGMIKQPASQNRAAQCIPVIAKAGKAWAEYPTWQALMKAWKTHLEALAQDFLNGQATVDPRKGPVCRYCHLKPLCRIQERTAGWGVGDDSEDESGDE